MPSEQSKRTSGAGKELQARIRELTEQDWSYRPERIKAKLQSVALAALESAQQTVKQVSDSAPTIEWDAGLEEAISAIQRLAEEVKHG